MQCENELCREHVMELFPARTINLPREVEYVRGRIPHHLRPQVMAEKRLLHPELCKPQADDYNAEGYGLMTFGGHRMIAGSLFRN